MSLAKAYECIHCGLPINSARADSMFCCYGCEVVHSVIGEKGDEADAQLTMYKFAAGCILGINVMMFSMPLYVESFGAFFRQGDGADSYFELLKYLLLALSLPVFFLLGSPFFESSFRSIKGGFRANADMLIAIGVTAAFLISIYNTLFTNGPVYYETAVGILVIVTGGRYLEARARSKATAATNLLESQLPEIAYVILPDGSFTGTLVEMLCVGQKILIKPGEVIPVDCTVKSGSANVSEAMLTGEPNPVLKEIGSNLLAGSINYDGLLTLEVIRTKNESYVAKLGEILEDAKRGKAKIQETADKASAIAVPLIMLIAIGGFIFWTIHTDVKTGLFVFLSVVLVACPCALGIATPAALWVAVMESSKRGILFRSLGAIERLAAVKTIFFDKTGTLTKGRPILKNIVCNQIFVDTHFGGNEGEMLTLVQAVSSISHHPLSQTLASSLPKNGFHVEDILRFKEYPSKGMSAHLDGFDIRIGKRSFVSTGCTSLEKIDSSKTEVWCSLADIAGEVHEAARFIFDDEVNVSASSVFDKLHAMEYQTMILSGDAESVAADLARELHTTSRGGLSPEEKVAFVSHSSDSAFVGDGMNDVGAIAAAGVGVALSHGSELLRAEADVILFDHNLRRIPEALALSVETMNVVRQNLYWAFGYNAIGVICAAMGLLNPIIAALAMALSSFFVVQNSLRLRSKIEKEGFADA